MVGRVLLVLLSGAAFVAVVGAALPSHPVQESFVPGKVTSPWGRKLDPSGRVPETGFRAYYFDRRNPDRLVFEENVDSLAIKYAWSDFHNIESPSFAAYWIGKVKFAKATAQQISVSQSWAKARIRIDGETVFDKSSSSGSFVHQFSKGEHVVEVEYINNWHTVEFKVTLQDVVPLLSEAEVADRLRLEAGPKANLYYVGLYESAARDTHVDVSVPATGRPAILWLTSYEAIDWNIVSRDPVKAVVVSSYAPGSRVRGNGSDRVLSLKGWRGLYGKSKKCSCVAGMFHCEGDADLGEMADRLFGATGRSLRGYAVDYSADRLVLQAYGPGDAEGVQRQRAAEAAMQAQCVARADPDFDTMFKRVN
jgi:hypothetical protein